MKQINLTQGQFALVDDEDFEYLNQWKWCVAKRKNNECIYAIRALLINKIRKANIRMSRLIMNPPPGLVVDHINGNGLDNRRENLRVCTRAQNNCNKKVRNDNKSLYKGVHKFPYPYKKKPWQARININGERKSLGYFSTPEDASEAYKQAAIKYHGEFARV